MLPMVFLKVVVITCFLQQEVEKEVYNTSFVLIIDSPSWGWSPHNEGCDHYLFYRL